MEILSLLSDEAILKELGQRIAHLRNERNLTQAELAKEAGVSKRTVERLETGTVASQMTVFIRVCRALGILEDLETFLPEAKPGPITQLKNRGKPRQRASSMKSKEKDQWSWTE